MMLLRITNAERLCVQFGSKIKKDRGERASPHVMIVDVINADRALQRALPPSGDC